MKMKWSILLVAALALMVLVTACGGSNNNGVTKNTENGSASNNTETPKPEEPETVREINIAHMFARTHQVHIALEEGNELLKEKSDGRLSFHIYSNGSYGEQFNSVEEVRMGSLDAFNSGLNRDYYKPAGALYAPYLFTDYDHWDRAKEAGLFDEILEGVSDAMGVVVTGLHQFGFRDVVTNGFKGESPKDYAGKTLRIVPVSPYQEVANILGSSGTNIGIGDVYMSLKTKVVDATENPLSQIHSEGFHEVGEYLIMTEHMIAPSVFLLSNDMMNSFSDKDRQIVLDVFNEIGDRIDVLTRESEQEYLKLLEEGGLEVVYPDKAPFMERAKEVIENYPEWMDTYEKVKAME
jgi:TRAP-type C4-dicarboxylate transport system substrate-binding protein